MDVDPDGTGLGTNPRQITSSSTPLSGPVYSPDGKIIAYSEPRPDQDICTTTLATGERLCITTNTRPDHDPTWSPDGTEVMFARNTSSIAVALFRVKLTTPGSDFPATNRTPARTSSSSRTGRSRRRRSRRRAPTPSPTPAPPPGGGGGAPEDTRPDPGSAPAPGAFLALDAPHRTTVAAFRKLGMTVVARCTALDKGAIKLTVSKRAKRRLRLPSATLAKAAATCDAATKRATVLLKPGGKVAKALGKGKAAKRPVTATLRASLTRGAARLTDKLAIRIGA